MKYTILKECLDSTRLPNRESCIALFDCVVETIKKIEQSLSFSHMGLNNEHAKFFSLSGSNNIHQNEQNTDIKSYLFNLESRLADNRMKFFTGLFNSALRVMGTELGKHIVYPEMKNSKIYEIGLRAYLHYPEPSNYEVSEGLLRDKDFIVRLAMRTVVSYSLEEMDLPPWILYVDKVVPEQTLTGALVEEPKVTQDLPISLVEQAEPEDIPNEPSTEELKASMANAIAASHVLTATMADILKKLDERT